MNRQQKDFVILLAQVTTYSALAFFLLEAFRAAL